MQITRKRPKTKSGPHEWFTGHVWLDPLAAPPSPARASMLSVHFAPGARTNWHTHPLGQTLYVTEGVGLVQRKGSPVEEIHAGDVVWFEPGEVHWHGAAADHFMTHIAMQEADEEGKAVDWGEPVTDAEYAG